MCLEEQLITVLLRSGHNSSTILQRKGSKQTCIVNVSRHGLISESRWMPLWMHVAALPYIYRCVIQAEGQPFPRSLGLFVTSPA